MKTIHSMIILVILLVYILMFTKSYSPFVLTQKHQKNTKGAKTRKWWENNYEPQLHKYFLFHMNHIFIISHPLLDKDKGTGSIIIRTKGIWHIYNVCSSIICSSIYFQEILLENCQKKSSYTITTTHPTHSSNRSTTPTMFYIALAEHHNHWY